MPHHHLLGDSLQARCAIYSRKSFQPPVAQDVTSLDSQRSICSSYIRSQQHKGWLELAKRYEDSGRTGANLDRPGLRELLSDIENGLVEIVVVYKLDRISRTLLDFIRLMDFFERYGVVFVAITQNFDTSDSMGRLIRNVLLTFAQFEREIASDRMRDKRMVMMQNGLWIGGDAPLGYDLRCGKLVPNGLEAPAVRCIFDTYVATGQIGKVYRELLRLDLHRKVWKTKGGHLKGGGPITLSSLHHILHNPIYVGEVGHGKRRYPGIHQPLIDRAVWDAAQRMLDERSGCRPRRLDHFLTGVLFDSLGRRMNAREYPSGGKRKQTTRYYETAIRLEGPGQKIRRARAKAEQIEGLVLASLKEFFSDRTRVRPVLMQANIFGATLEDLVRLTPAVAVRLDRLSVMQLSSAIKALLTRVEVAEDCARLICRVYALAKFIGWDGVGRFKLDDIELARATRMHVIVVPVTVTRHRRTLWLPLTRAAPGSVPDQNLTRLIRHARAAQQAFFEQRNKSLTEIARLSGKRVGSFSKLVRLNYLAPDIIAAIFDGTQPLDLSRRKLLDADIPMDWALQRRLLGFPPRNELAMMER